MTSQHGTIPPPEERARRNEALTAHGTETGFWDGDGTPAPWPGDIDNWRPEAGTPRRPAPGEPPF